VDKNELLVGVVTRRDILDDSHAGPRRIGDLVKRPPAVIFDDSSLREAADHMVREGVGRLPVVERRAPRRAIGVISRSDLLSAHRRRLAEGEYAIAATAGSVKPERKPLFG
jgi:CBS domain-containing protein